MALLSDMYKFEAEITRPWGRFGGFDQVVLSAEAGLTKHDIEAFGKMLKWFGIPADRSLFVDDRIEHVRTAEVAGIDTIWVDRDQYKNANQLATQIKQKIFD